MVESSFLSSVITSASLICVLKCIGDCQSGEISFAVRGDRMNELESVKGIAVNRLIWVEATQSRRQGHNLKWHFCNSVLTLWRLTSQSRLCQFNDLNTRTAIEAALPTDLLKDCITWVAYLANCVKAKNAFTFFDKQVKHFFVFWSFFGMFAILLHLAASFPFYCLTVA